MNYCFNAMLIHGLSPDSMILGTMVLSLRIERNQYHSCIIGNILDWVPLIKESHILKSSNLQSSVVVYDGNGKILQFY